MKNSLLATAVASTLLLASSAHAFTGKIEFTGKLVDKNPYWSIGIPAKSVQDAKGWKSKLSDGKAIKGNKTEFSFKKDIPFVQGHMTKLLTKRGANHKLMAIGVEPIVTIAGHKLNWQENNENGSKPKELSVKIKGQAYGSDTKDGVLDFTLDDGASFFIKKNGLFSSSVNINNDNKLSSQQKKAASLLSELIKKIIDVAPSNKLKIKTKHVTLSPISSAQSLDIAKINGASGYAGAFVTNLSNFKATFDNDAIPEKWTASIPVTISYK